MNIAELRANLEAEERMWEDYYREQEQKDLAEQFGEALGKIRAAHRGAEEETVYLIEEEIDEDDFEMALDYIARFIRLCNRINLEKAGDLPGDIATWADGLGTEAQLFLNGFDENCRRIPVEEDK